jgi:hypothetical protein
MSPLSCQHDKYGKTFPCVGPHVGSLQSFNTTIDISALDDTAGAVVAGS